MNSEISNGHYLLADPDELMRDNPAALILNKESYADMDAYFSPEQFSPPQVCRVASFSAEHGEVVRLFVRDGLTRTRFASDHKDRIRPEASDFRFNLLRVQDITESLILNHRIVPVTERVEGQTSLTMLQYLRAIIPVTVEHSEIAADRIAAHLINGWENMVGEELARKYSALAAISLLENQRVPTATDDMLQRFLSNQGEVMAGETADERVELQQHLMEMNSIIRQSKKFKGQVGQSAFALVSADVSVIGGEREARKQIYGLLRAPEFERKLNEELSEIGERERKRAGLGELISSNVRRFFAEGKNSQELLTLASAALRDPQLHLPELETILSAESPMEKEAEVKREINVQNLTRFYQLSLRKIDLDSTELIFLDKLGRVRHLADNDMAGITRTIKSANDVITRAVQYKESLTEKVDKLLQRGAKQETIAEARQKIEDLVRNGFDVATVAQLSARSSQLGEIVAEYERRINREIKVKQVTNTVDEVFSERLQGKNAALVRAGAVAYILRDINFEDENTVRTALETLKTLDEDLQDQVIRGPMRISVATHIQRDRELERQRQISQPPLQPAEPELDSVSHDIRISRITVPDQPTSVESTSEQAQVVESVDTEADDLEDQLRLQREQLERQRIESGNATIRQGVEAMIQALRVSDIEFDGLTATNKNLFDKMLIELGKFRFNHRDLIRIIDDYPRLLERNRHLQGQLLQAEERRNQLDTQTGR